MGAFVRELRRRKVLRTAVGYLAAAWLVVQVLETLFPLFDLPNAWIRWAIIVLAALFVPVLVLSWTFQWSPSGLERQADLDSGMAAGAADSRRLDRILIALLTIAVLYFTIDKFLLPAIDAGAGRQPSIAVLPFKDLTAAQDKAYFADGFAEELVDVFARNTALKVAASTSSFSFRGADLPVAEIASRLRVAYILEGSVRALAERAEISVRLVSARDGYNVWSQSFDRDLDDIVAVKNEILHNVENAVGVAATPGADPRRATTSDSYVLTLQASYLASSLTPDGQKKAVELYRQALESDPENVVAWVNLATVYANMANSGHLDWDSGYRLAREAALKAVAIDSEYAGGFRILSTIARMFEGDLDTATGALNRALELRPTELGILAEAATLLLNLGELDKAILLREYLVERSPVDVIDTWNLALAYRYGNRLADAERVFRRVRELRSSYEALDYQLGETLLLAGRYEEALAAFSAEEDESYRLKGQALAQFSLGNVAASDEALAAMIEAYGERWPSEVVHVHAWRGELDAAFAWLDREYDAYGPGGWGEWQLQRLYDNLRDDPRWQAFLRRTGTAPEQLAGLSLELSPDLYD